MPDFELHVHPPEHNVRKTGCIHALEEMGFDLSSALSRFFAVWALQDSEENAQELFSALENGDVEIRQFAALGLTRLMNEKRYEVFKRWYFPQTIGAQDAPSALDNLPLGESVFVRNIPDVDALKAIISREYEVNIICFPETFPGKIYMDSFMVMMTGGELRLVVFKGEQIGRIKQRVYEGDNEAGQELRKIGVIGNGVIAFTKGWDWCPIMLPCVGMDGHSHPAESEDSMPSNTDLLTCWGISSLRAGKVD